MKNKGFLLFLLLVLACIWFIVAWAYISLYIYDMSELKAGAYKVLEYREKFIEMGMMVGIFLLWICIGTCGTLTNSSIQRKKDLYGFEPKKWNLDNLQLIEWIGPKIEQVLRNAGVTTFHGLANASSRDILRILEKAGKKFALANPNTWSEQAHMANMWRWRELKSYQDELLWGL